MILKNRAVIENKLESSRATKNTLLLNGSNERTVIIKGVGAILFRPNAKRAEDVDELLMTPSKSKEVKVNSYLVDGHPGHIRVWRVQSFGLQSILVHQLVPQITLNASHHRLPLQAGVVKAGALQEHT